MTRSLPKLFRWTSLRSPEHMLATKQLNASADVCALERELENLGYALYDPMPEGIQIVEDAASV